MSTETDREALALYPFDGSDPNLILALHAAFRAGAEFAAALTATSVVPEAVFEAVARALSDDWNPGRDPVLTAMFRDYAHTALTAALPFLTAAPSATRDEVRDEIAGHPIGSGYYGTSVSVEEAAEIADTLLARFTITPKEDR